jgi:hypothetical protein
MPFKVFRGWDFSLELLLTYYCFPLISQLAKDLIHVVQHYAQGILFVLPIPHFQPEHDANQTLEYAKISHLLWDYILVSSKFGSETSISMLVNEPKCFSICKKICTFRTNKPLTSFNTKLQNDTSDLLTHYFFARALLASSSRCAHTI